MNDLYEHITNQVTEVFEITDSQLKSKSRKHHIVNPRHVWHWLLRIHLDWTYSRIGKLSERDHSTVMASIDVIDNSLGMNGDGGLGKEELRLFKKINDEINEFNKFRAKWNV